MLQSLSARSSAAALAVLFAALAGLAAVPEAFALSSNYPNPFNPTTTIPFALPEAAQVTIAVYDVTGRHVKTLLRQRQAAGEHAVTWDGTDEAGHSMPSGVYAYTIRAGSSRQSRMMIRLK